MDDDDEEGDLFPMDYDDWHDLVEYSVESPTEKPKKRGNRGGIPRPVLETHVGDYSAPIYSLPPEILRQIAKYLPIDLFLGDLAFSSKALFGFLLSDLVYASSHLVNQGRVVPIVEPFPANPPPPPPPDDPMAFSSEVIKELCEISREFFDSLPLNYKTAFLLECFAGRANHLTVYDKDGNSAKLWRIFESGRIHISHAVVKDVVSRIMTLKPEKSRPALQSSIITNWLLEYLYKDAFELVLPHLGVSKLSDAFIEATGIYGTAKELLEMVEIVFKNPDVADEVDFSDYFEFACTSHYDKLVFLLMQYCDDLPLEQGFQNVVENVEEEGCEYSSIVLITEFLKYPVSPEGIDFSEVISVSAKKGSLVLFKSVVPFLTFDTDFHDILEDMAETIGEIRYRDGHMPIFELLLAHPKCPKGIDLADLCMTASYLGLVGFSRCLFEYLDSSRIVKKYFKLVLSWTTNEDNLPINLDILKMVLSLPRSRGMNVFEFVAKVGTLCTDGALEAIQLCLKASDVVVKGSSEAITGMYASVDTEGHGAVARVFVEDKRMWPDLKEYSAHADKRLAFALWAGDQNLASVVRELRLTLSDASQAILSSHINQHSTRLSNVYIPPDVAQAVISRILTLKREKFRPALQTAATATWRVEEATDSHGDQKEFVQIVSVVLQNPEVAAKVDFSDTFLKACIKGFEDLVSVLMQGRPNLPLGEGFEKVVENLSEGNIFDFMDSSDVVEKYFEDMVEYMTNEDDYPVNLEVLAMVLTLPSAKGVNVFEFVARAFTMSTDDTYEAIELWLEAPGVVVEGSGKDVEDMYVSVDKHTLLEYKRIWPDLKEYVAHSDKRLAFALWAADRNLATVVRELRLTLSDASMAFLSSHVGQNLEEGEEDDEYSDEKGYI
ncbi:hypothetical protein HDU98_007867 [Podochytrium sp. JEL0797]|nr:hypothetical protein HDU98_007864 [Podochytrium sp. JEL0797]KAJ3069050.1 hypothetical protein HDU98_007867 [Podochytrium sp. JEL0797]